MRKIMLLRLFLIISFLSGCTNEQLEQAIQDCNNDPECYVIIDTAIDAEMESRGIVGGTMTSLEMEKLYEILESYKIEYLDLRRLFFQESLENTYEFTDQYSFQEIEQMSYNYLTLRDYANFLNLRELNENDVQYFLNGTDKYIIYKDGLHNIVYEIYSDTVSTIIVDLELEIMYINDIRIENTNNTFESYFTGEYSNDYFALESKDDFYYVEIFEMDSSIFNIFFRAYDYNENMMYHLQVSNNRVIFNIASEEGTVGYSLDTLTYNIENSEFFTFFLDEDNLVANTGSESVQDSYIALALFRDIYEKYLETQEK